MVASFRSPFNSNIQDDMFLEEEGEEVSDMLLFYDENIIQSKSVRTEIRRNVAKNACFWVLSAIMLRFWCSEAALYMLSFVRENNISTII